MSTLEMLTDTGVRIGVKTWVVVVLVWILTEIGDMNGVERVLVKIHAGKNAQNALLYTIICIYVYVYKYACIYIFFSNIYRGTAAFSEPETKAVRDFIMDRKQNQTFLVSFIPFRFICKHKYRYQWTLI